MDLDLEYDDLQPGISPDEQQLGIRRVIQIGAGILLLLSGIAMIFVPGPGLLTALVGLNLIKPDNAVVRWIRLKVPGIPEDGKVPKRYLAIGLLFFAATAVVSVIYGDDFFNWVKRLF